MKTTRNLFTLFALSLLVTSCDSVIYDDLAACPEGLVIDLRPRYAARNIFEGEVNDVHITLLDANKATVKEIEVKEDELKENNYSVTMTGINPGDYSLVVWNGLCDTENYRLLDDHSVVLKRENNETNKVFTPLWHGNLDAVKVVQDQQTRVVVPMIKDTNDVVVMVHDDTGETFDVDRFSYAITCNNSAMDAKNVLTDTDVVWYNDFKHTVEYIEGSVYDTEGPLEMARGELNTLRITTERPAYLTIHDNLSGTTVLSINLTDYILKARASAGAVSTMSNSEYLDTEDHFNLTFFLTKRGDQYMCAMFVVNDWVVRMNYAEL